ncbi:transcription factor S-II [Colletotrichum limetticola]|uniref:Transcription factor S-II n=1 Tax=Colletotrichum limetticola TaxID=1209924 RepID=A0ABQ9PLQ4_9PEZI|nr:transcription factor S-II [Colletotrichum limetticola]
MSAIGTLVFCTDCGNLLPASMGTEKNTLTCDCCGADNKGRLIAAGVLGCNSLQDSKLTRSTQILAPRRLLHRPSLPISLPNSDRSFSLTFRLSTEPTSTPRPRSGRHAPSAAQRRSASPPCSFAVQTKAAPSFSPANVVSSTPMPRFIPTELAISQLHTNRLVFPGGLITTEMH